MLHIYIKEGMLMNRRIVGRREREQIKVLFLTKAVFFFGSFFDFKATIFFILYFLDRVFIGQKSDY